MVHFHYLFVLVKEILQEVWSTVFVNKILVKSERNKEFKTLIKRKLEYFHEFQRNAENRVREIMKDTEEQYRMIKVNLQGTHNSP